MESNICEGCQRIHGSCMCRTTLPVKMEDVKAARKKTSLAEELKEVAAKAREQKALLAGSTLALCLIRIARQQADLGGTKLDAWADTYHFSKEEAEVAFKELEKKGFKCTLKEEVTSMWSNTDWDSDLLLTVSWE